jgi:hypothetical protein
VGDELFSCDFLKHFKTISYAFRFPQASFLKNMPYSGFFRNFCQVGMRFAFYNLVKNQEQPYVFI